MLTTVAAERRCDPLTLLDEPMWRVLWQFYHHQERAQRDALLARLARVDLGMMVAFAFNQPDALNEENRTAKQALVDFARGPSDVRDEIAMLRAAGEALAARIEHGRVLSPGALLS